MNESPADIVERPTAAGTEGQSGSVVDGRPPALSGSQAERVAHVAVAILLLAMSVIVFSRNVSHATVVE